MGKIAVVTDSVSNLPPEIAARYGIAVVPIYLHWDGQVYRDGIDISSDEVYRRLLGSESVPKSAAPSAGDFLQTYLRLGQQAEGIVSVHLPLKLSATIEAARIAVDLVAGKVSVRVVDAGTTAMGAGFVALAAARAAATGADLETVVQAACAVKSRVKIYFIVDTLKYLHLSGRIGRAASLVGTALQIKPIVCINDNEVDVVAKPRTRSRAVDVMLDRMTQDVSGRPMHVAVAHGGAAEEANVLRERVEARFDCVEVLTTIFTSVMGANAGPGVLGVAFYPEDEWRWPGKQPFSSSAPTC